MKYINPHKLFVGCMIPNWLCERSELTHGAKILYARLSQHARTDGTAWPAVETLAPELGVSSRQIDNYLSELKAQKLVLATRRGLGRTNMYRFLWHSWMGGNSRSAINDAPDTQDIADHIAQSSSYPLMKDPSEGSNRRILSPTDFVSEDEHMTSVDLMESWNEHCVPKGLTRVRMTGTRQRKTQLRLKEHPSVEFWSEVLTHILASPFLLGQKNNGDRRWKVDFDFLIANDTNAVKIIEGKYDEPPPSPQRYLGR